MLRILKILSIASMALAALTVVVVASQIIRAGRESALLSEPGAVELYKQRAGSVKPTTETESPLVKQAKLLALAFNPPPPEPPKTTAKAPPTGPKESLKPVEERPDPKVSLNPKFKLLATACYTSVPEKSLALLDLTSQGPKWYRQGETVEGLTIHEIKEKEVTLYQGGKPNSIVAMVQSPTIFPSILKGDSAAGQPVIPASTLLSGADSANPNSVSPPNLALRDLPQPMEKRTPEELQTTGAAMIPSTSGMTDKAATDPGADPRTPTRRAGTRLPVQPTRTIPNAPVKTVAPPPTPEQQRAELDKNIEDIRKLMNTPSDGSTGGDPSEDQKAWGELLQLLEEERRSLDAAAGGPGAAPSTPGATPSSSPSPPSAEQRPETPPSSGPAPSGNPSEGEPPPAAQPPSDSPPASTENGEN